jgi:multiple sugar transport system ATP-binding protein
MDFQTYALYPHLSVFENIAFPLRLKNVPESEVQTRVNEAAQLLQLTEHLQRKPANLSGGQRQRVAMGRAIVRQADAFLFDEPLSNLDAKLRGQMRTEIARIQRRLGTTTVYVTHDQTEAMTLGDRIAVLRKGFLQQVGSAHQLYEEPANLFVAGFIGSPPMNFVPGRIKDGRVDTPFGNVPVTSERIRRIGDRDVVILGFRPEYFEDASLMRNERRGQGHTFAVDVDITEWLGNELYAYVPYEAPAEISDKLRDLQRELDSEHMRTQLVVALDPSSRIRSGSKAELWFDPGRLHVFDPASGDNLTRDPERTFDDDQAHAGVAADGPSGDGKVS